MRISQPSVSPSLHDPGRIRVSARVQFASWLARRETIWFEVDQSMAGQASTSGNPWVVGLLPLAFVTGEAIELEPDVDATVLENASRLMAVWSQWYPEFSPIPITAGTTSRAAAGRDRLTGLFFSGGVDSIYTFLHDRETTGGTIDELIYVQGADSPLDNPLAFRRAWSSIQALADEWGMRTNLISTNLRSTRFRLVHWDLIGSSPALAAAALVLEPRYIRLLLSSTWPQKDLHPLSSHPETDPLLSTNLTSFEHYGLWIDRIGKTEFIARDPLVLEHLRVCWESEAGGNCGQCLKCIRTMTALEVMGKLPEAQTFKADTLDLSLLARQYMGPGRAYFAQLRDYALTYDRPDVARAVEESFKRTDTLDRYGLGLVRNFRMRLRRNPTMRWLLMRPAAWLRGLAKWINHRIPRDGQAIR